MPVKELMLDTCVWVVEGTVLRLEDRANVRVWGDDIETCKEVVVRQHNDALCCGKGLPKAGVE